MPDEQGNVEGEPTDTPLHAQKEGRDEDAEVDPHDGEPPEPPRGESENATGA